MAGNGSRAFPEPAESADGNGPSRLDELPFPGDILAEAPDRLKEALLAAFDIQALCNKDMNQVTLWTTLTDPPPSATS